MTFDIGVEQVLVQAQQGRRHFREQAGAVTAQQFKRIALAQILVQSRLSLIGEEHPGDHIPSTRLGQGGGLLN
jgi:hypothetical protein